MRTRTLVAALPLVAAGLACSSSAGDVRLSAPDPTAPATASPRRALRQRRTAAETLVARSVSAHAAPGSGSRRAVNGLDFPWDVQQLPDGALLVTERDRAPALDRARAARSVARLPGRPGLGLRRDRPDVDGGRPRLPTTAASTPARASSGRAPATCGSWRGRSTPADPRQEAPGPARRAAHDQRPARRLPAADRPRVGRAPRRHRRCRRRHQPARPHLARRQDAAARPVDRQRPGPATRSSTPGNPSSATS